MLFVFPLCSCCLSGIPFPKNFIQICKKILCRLFRVFVHVYIHHFDRILLMGAEAHVNTCYKHFYYFATELNLIDRKELEPLVRHSTHTRLHENNQIYSDLSHSHTFDQLDSAPVTALNSLLPPAVCPVLSQQPLVQQSLAW